MTPGIDDAAENLISVGQRIDRWRNSDKPKPHKVSLCLLACEAALSMCEPGTHWHEYAKQHHATAVRMSRDVTRHPGAASFVFDLAFDCIDGCLRALTDGERILADELQATQCKP